MAFKDIVNKAQDLTGSAAEATGKLLDEFNEALPTMRALGFSVSDFRVGMGLLPEIGAKLVIPCHYDMFEFNTATPDEFVAECQRLNQPYRVLKLGERWSSTELANSAPPLPSGRT